MVVYKHRPISLSCFEMKEGPVSSTNKEVAGTHHDWGDNKNNGSHDLDNPRFTCRADVTFRAKRDRTGT